MAGPYDIRPAPRGPDARARHALCLRGPRLLLALLGHRPGLGGARLPRADRGADGRGEEEAAETAEAGRDPSIVPVGIPLIPGLGAISTVVVLVGQAGATAIGIQFFISGAATAAVQILREAR